jgi:hypothetical protein
MRDKNKVTRDKNKNALIINYMTLRKLIGWMGVTLPIVVYLGNWLIFTHQVGSCLIPSSNVPYSLSGYYYTHMRGVFTGTFWALGLFLVAYNGYEIWDQVVTTFAGLAAIGIATFPTAPPTKFLAEQAGTCGPRIPVTYTSSMHQSGVSYVHQGSLFVLLATLFVMALRFTKTDKAAQKTEQELRRKKRNNRFYVISAVGIFAGGVGALIQNFLTATQKAQTPWLFWFEMVAIFSFGLAWFVKGEALTPVARFMRARRQQQKQVQEQEEEQPA